MSIRDRIKKASVIKETDILTNSKFFADQDIIPTKVPMINVALSGEVDGGLTPGFTMIAGPSKHFKSSFALMMASSYLAKYPDPETTIVFYDTEFGSPISYFKAYGVNTDQVVHKPATNVEQLKFDLVAMLEELKANERVLIIIDSIGNVASKKELEDAINEKSVADMSRAKALKSMFRTVTPYLRKLNIPLIGINHTYKELCLEGSTKIKTSKGLIEIKNIKPGYEVYALTGLQKVLATYGPRDLIPVDKKFIELEFDDGHKVKCTHDHLFLIEGQNWVRAIDLKIGQKMY